MQNLKLDPAVGPGDPAGLMRQLGSIASSTPVFELTVSRGWERIDDVVARILEWHAEPNGSAISRPQAIAVPA
jgi:hypothetical protein